jgi:hypothetical protein
MTSLFSTAALIAILGVTGISSAALAHDNDRDGYHDSGRYGWQGDRDDHHDGRHHHDRDRERGYYAQQGYSGRQGYYAPQGYYVQQGGYAQQPYYNRGYSPGYGGNGYGGQYQQRPASYGYNRDTPYRCNNGSTGTILGAIAGGLIGNGVAGRGDKVLGTVIGGGAGAVVGNSIDKGNRRC